MKSWRNKRAHLQKLEAQPFCDPSIVRQENGKVRLSIRVRSTNSMTTLTRLFTFQPNYLHLMLSVSFEIIERQYYSYLSSLLVEEMLYILRLNIWIQRRERKTGVVFVHSNKRAIKSVAYLAARFSRKLPILFLRIVSSTKLWTLKARSLRRIVRRKRRRR